MIDDDKQVMIGIKLTLNLFGINNIICCEDSRKVLPLLSESEISTILLDLTMPYISGEEILHEVSLHYPEIPVIVVTGANEVDTAVKCMKEGAFDYMVKPVEENRLISGVKRAVELRELKHENSMLRQRLHSERLEHPEAFAGIVTQNQTMLSIFRYIETIAVTAKPVLITGETGSGKELIAKAFHYLCGSEKPFVTVNVAGLDDHMFSDTLFGHTKGAFTNANEARDGLIHHASGGILFLDEIGDLTTVSQIKLLRLLQESEYMPLGSDMVKKSNVRIIVATNRDMDYLQKSGTFRKDLYYRLNNHHVHLPPLNERKDDICLLLNHFLEKASEELGKKKPTPPCELIDLLATYSFPGNIREFESMVFEAISNHTSKMLSMDVFKSRILQDHSPQKTESDLPTISTTPPLTVPGNFPTLQVATDFLITDALTRANGNQTIAAQLLGISRSTLCKRLKRDTQ
ncbi:sigma-54-dependent transcriptional regulator [Candidatus Latescibacterota bacterium]